MRSDLLPSTVDLLKKIRVDAIVRSSHIAGVVSNASHINPITKKKSISML